MPRAAALILALPLLLLTVLGAPAPATAQSALHLRVALETNAATLVGTDDSRTEIEIHRAGALVAIGLVHARRPSEVAYVFFWRTEPARVLAGDVIRLAGAGGALPTAEVTVPEMRADFDDLGGRGGGRILGIGPVAAELRVRVEYHTTTGGVDGVRTFDEPVHTGPDGRFTINLPNARLVPGDRGDVSWEDAAGHTFSAPIAVFQGHLTLGQPRVTLDSALGLAARIEQSGAGGAVLTGRDLLTGGSMDDTRLGVTDVHLGAPVSAGEVLTVTIQHPLLGPESVHAVRVPPLALQIVPQTDTVIGQAPPGTLVTVAIRAPDGSEQVRRVTSAPDGRVVADFAGTADIDRGWRAEIAVDAGEGWRVRAEALVGLLHIETDVSLIRGEIAPDTDVTVVAYDPRGTELRRWEATSDANGRFGVDLILSGGQIEAEVLALTPGMVIGVDLAHSGDPTLLEIPALTAHADIDREMVTGAAPTGSRVLVEVLDGTRVVARSAELQVGGDGRYEAPLAAGYDLEPGAVGRMTLMRPDGHQMSLTWVAVNSRLELDTGILWVNAPTNRVGAARLLGPAGVERASLSLTTRRETLSSRRLSAVEPFVDRFGRPVLPAPGDRVEGWIGDERFSFAVPRLGAAVHVAADRVAGSTDAPADTPLVLDASDSSGGGRAIRNAQVPDGGGFTFDLTQAQADAGPFDLRFNARVTLRLDRRAERISRRIAVPGLVLDLGGAVLMGTLAPDALGTASWRRGGQTFASVPVQADATGAFAAHLRHPDGRRFDLQPGDMVVLESADLVPEVPVQLAVPRLELALDRAANALHGRVGRSPGDRFRLTTERLQSLPDVLDNGRWDEQLTWFDGEHFSIDFDDHPVPNPLTGESRIFTVVTGAAAEATLDLPDGHRVRLARLLPLLHIQHGGGLVCGQADPDTAVGLRLRSAAGELLAEARALAAPDGKFRVDLKGATAEPGSAVRMQAGMRVEGELGSEALALTLPPMGVDFDWSAYSLRLRGLPLHEYRVRYPALWDCWGGLTEALRALPGLYVSTSAPMTDADGVLIHDATRLFDRGASPAQGLQVETTDPSLHRLFTYVLALQAEIHLGTDRVLGQASPNREITGRLERADGIPLARGTAASDGDGRVTLQITPEGRTSATLHAGQTLVLTTEGETARIELPTLDFDYSPTTGVLGIAAPDTAVRLTFRLPDGRSPITSVLSDATGRFAFAPADLPRGEDWTLADVQTVRAEYGFARHHRVVRDMADADTVDPGPPPGGGAAVYLPWAVGGRGRQ